MYQIGYEFVYNLFVHGHTELNKHQQKTATTKNKLFKAAQRSFAKQGFEAASIDQIARSAGFTRGAFYAHFKSKEDLFLAMLEDRSAQELTGLRREMEGIPDDKQVELLRRYCLERLRDIQWSLLMLEFKLYIARRGSKGAKIADRFQALRNNLKQQYLDDVLPQVIRDTKMSMGTHILFEALMDGLSLQRAYKGASVTEEDAEREMNRAFNILLDNPVGSYSTRSRT
jgi:AcrR family transcriptional regulator